MNAPSRHLSCYSSYTGASSRGWRFRPYTSTVGLDAKLKMRSFAGYHPEDTLQCRAAAWVTEEGLSVLLSPAPGLPAPALSRHFERLASLYFLELVARGLVQRDRPVRWHQHWPARDAAPDAHRQDRFERVWVTPFAVHTCGAPPARDTVSAGEALAGLTSTEPAAPSHLA